MGKDTHDSVSRAERKAKKRQLEDAIPDLPGDDDGTDVVDDSTEKSKKRKRSGDDNSEKEGKNSKKDKKRKSSDVDEEASEKPKKEKSTKSGKTTSELPSADSVEDGQQADAPKKSKKERKAERKALEAAAKQAAGHAKEEKSAVKIIDSNITKEEKAPVESSKSTEATVDSRAGETGASEKKKNNRNREKKRRAAAEAAANGEKTTPRFIVFVGNLPFTANKTSIEAHFGSVKPKSIRCLTQKDDPKKCKGCAFVEFDGYDHMKTCLKLFHHSEFNDGVSPPRKINVELTAGGGGKSKDRQAKIGEKNQKLNEQRIRRMQEEEKAKFTKKNAGVADSDGIHPSRRGIVPGA